MKLNRLFGLLAIGIFGVSITSCGQEEQPDIDSTEISEEDKIRPNSTKLEYVDYGLLGDGNGMPEYDTTKWYRNDLDKVPLPDPHVYYEDGTYYIYGTTDRTGAQSLDCYTTTDFVDFKIYTDILRPNSNANPSNWEGNQLFAPEMYKFGDYYYLYYSNIMKNENTGAHYLHVVKGESPLGPFNQINEKNAEGVTINGTAEPVFKLPNEKVNAIDSTIFVDDDGKMYMYFVISGNTQHIEGCEMKDPITCDWSTRKEVIIPGEIGVGTSLGLLFWEAYNGYKIAEAPYMLKSPNGKYYMTYSVNDYQNRYYSICYAVSDTPLGDFKKPFTSEQNKNGEYWTNLLLGYGGPKTGSVLDQWDGFSSGNGHHCFFNVGNQIMIGYHQHKNRKNASSGRSFAMDYVYFDEEGVPYTDGPTWSLQPVPEAISGYKNIALNAKVKSSNVDNIEAVNDNYIVRHHNLKQEEGKEVVLKEGKAYIELIFDKEYTIGGIMINNSAWYDKSLSEISYINFFNDNVIYNATFMMNYYNEDKEFVFPGSAFNVDFNDIKASKVIICFDTTTGAQINEIKVLGK